MPSNTPIHSPPLLAHFVHTLLRARDWQDRPEFDQLCDWWRGSVTPNSEARGPNYPGVCVLVGIGGAGKTAIADRFLRLVPGGLRALPDTPKDETLPSLGGLFVFSFYDAPNPDHFFAQLSAWLSGTPFDESAKTPSYQQTPQLLSNVAQTRIAEAGSVSSAGLHSSLATRHSPLLLILDGLEKVQDDGARGGAFGQLLDGRLRGLILRAADGWLPGVALLITTRFRLFDVEAERCDRYRPIDIDRLQPPAALALLRARGVRATDAQLLALAEESGFHALTLDLLGGYVAAFCDGDPSRLPPLAEVKVPNEAAAEDPRLAAVKEQERRFGRLAQRYREALAARDPAALALMERVCLFRLGVNADTLASIFTGAGKETVSGPALAGLNREQVGKKLRLLAQRRLLDESKPPSTRNSTSSQPSPNYAVHPAVRHGFLAGLTIDIARQCHRASVADFHRRLPSELKARVADIPLLNFLSGAPPSFRINDPALLRRLSSRPSVPAALDLLEETVYHLVHAGYWEQAWDIYHHVLGGYGGLALRLGECRRGERLCRLLGGGVSANAFRLPASVMGGSPLSVLLLDWGRFLIALGELGPARRLLGYLCDQRVTVGDTDFRPAACRMLAELELEAGRLTDAADVLSTRVQNATTLWSASDLADASAYLAFTALLRGECVAAAKDFECALHWQRRHDRDENPLYGRRGYLCSQFLHRLGRQVEAEALIEKAKGIGILYGGPQNQDAPSFDFESAALMVERGDLSAARGIWQRACDWVLSHDAVGLFCTSSLLRARIEIAEASSHESEARREALLAEAGKSLDEGLRIARDCGYGIYHVDLLLERACLHLLHGEPQPALDDLRVALDDGQKPPPDSGFPTLLAATDPECAYAWGIAEGRHLRAQAFLLRGAQTLGRPDFAPANFKALPAEVHSLIESARKELEECHELQRRIQDPKIKETQATLDRLDDGHLTDYPLQRTTMKTLDWITNGLSAATAAMSTAPPDQWADGRVVGVATSTFLLGALQARRAERDKASQDEVIASVRKGLQDLEERLAASEAGRARWTTKLKESLSQELTAVALNVEACHGRIAELDKSVGSILHRLTQVEEFVHAHARTESVLVSLVDRSFADLSLPAQNHTHNILNDRFTKEHLSVLAERCGVDWDNLAGETKSKKALELIKECRNSGRFAKLIEEIELKRPGVLGLPKGVAELVIHVVPARSAAPSAASQQQSVQDRLSAPQRKEFGDGSVCKLRASRTEAERKLTERIDTGQSLLASLCQLKEAVLRTTGNELRGRAEDERRQEELWSDYLVWTDFNQELLRRAFDSPQMALEYSQPREPEQTWGVFLSELKEFEHDLRDDLQRLKSIKQRLTLFA
jgi:hypothetical protein